MSLNTVDELYAFTNLNSNLVQPSFMSNALNTASVKVNLFSPLDVDDDRSVRVDPVRKEAEIYLGGSIAYRSYAMTTFQGLPSKQVLSAGNLMLGTDFPTPDLLLSAINRVADQWKAEGMELLKAIRPVTSSVSAGPDIE